MTREWLLRLPAWGKKMRCYSRWRHGAEKVGVETKMCLFMPTGVLTLLRAAFAFCQERELKGHSQDMETSTSFWLPLYSISSCSSFFEVSFNRRWKRRLPTEVQLKKNSRFCPFKVNMEMPECTQPASLPEQRGRSCGVQSESDDWWL